MTMTVCHYFDNESNNNAILLFFDFILYSDSATNYLRVSSVSTENVKHIKQRLGQKICRSAKSVGFKALTYYPIQ